MHRNVAFLRPSMLLVLSLAGGVPAHASECTASRPLFTSPSSAAELVRSPGLAGFDTPRGERWSGDALEAEIVAADPLAGPPSTLRVRLFRDSGTDPGTEVCKARNLTPEIRPLLGGWRVRVHLPAACALCAGQRYRLSIQAFGPTTTYQWKAVDPASSSKPFVLHGQSQELVAVKGDFNGDLCPDLVFQEQSPRGRAGRVKVWWMNGAVKVGEGSLPTPPLPWRVVAAGFGEEENTVTSNTLTLQNPESGAVRLWQLRDLVLIEEQVVVADPEHGEAYPKPDRRIVAADDFLLSEVSPRRAGGGGANHVCMGEGGGLIIWNGGPSTVSTPGGGVSTVVPYPGGVVPEPAQVDLRREHPRVAADLSGDGYPDLVLQSPLSRQVAIWQMELATAPSGDPQPTRVEESQLWPAPPPGWQLAAAGDFGAGPGAGSTGPAPLCGAPDLVFQDAATGGLFIWHLNHNLERTGATALGNPGPGWVLVAPR